MTPADLGPLDAYVGGLLAALGFAFSFLVALACAFDYFSTRRRDR